MIENSLIDYIKVTRKNKKISQQDMADKLGVSLRSYQRIENKETEISLKHFLKIIDILNKDFMKMIERATLLTSSELNENKIFIKKNSDQRNKVVDKKRVDENSSEFKYLKAKFEKLRTTNPTTVGYVEWCLDHFEFYYSPEIYHIFDVSPNQVIEYQSIAPRIHERDRLKLESALENLVVYGEPYNFKYKIQRQDGSTQINQGIFEKVKHHECDLVIGFIASYIKS